MLSHHQHVYLVCVLGNKVARVFTPSLWRILSKSCPHPLCVCEEVCATLSHCVGVTWARLPPTMLPHHQHIYLVCELAIK